MLRWVSIAPFATPVVPPVYCRNAMSSRVTSTGLNGAVAPRASAARKAMAPSMRQAGTIFFTRLTTKLTIQRFGRRQQVADLRRDHVLDRRVREHLLQRMRRSSRR